MKKPTIESENVHVDPRTDTVGKLLVAVEKYETWTKDRRILVDKVVKNMKRGRHIEFPGYSDRYRLSRVGTSLLYDVPENKRGKLAPFRGQLIRLVCIGSGSRFFRSYIAKPYRSTEDKSNV
jgi:hypothetical protein